VRRVISTNPRCNSPWQWWFTITSNYLFR